MHAVSYVVPLRAAAAPDPELVSYIDTIASWCEVIVVDGSCDEVFRAAERVWGATSRHVRPDRWPSRAPDENGKVSAVLTGLRLATHERVIIADDDVRYDEHALRRVTALLDHGDVVRPQNYFEPAWWHTHWDTARTLVARAVGGDFPGTLAVRARTLRAAGGYDAHVLFENLELIRTIQAAGGVLVDAPDLFVARRPPSFAQFRSQRVRQAYDELARPPRLACALLVVPLLAFAAVRGAWRSIGLVTIASFAIAETGRRRHDGRVHLPARAVALTPLWILERGVCAWAAVAHRARGGCPYAGGRLRAAAHSRRNIERRRRRARCEEPSMR
jgi:hypothetical protein